MGVIQLFVPINKYKLPFTKYILLLLLRIMGEKEYVESVKKQIKYINRIREIERKKLMGRGTSQKPQKKIKKEIIKEVSLNLKDNKLSEHLNKRHPDTDIFMQQYDNFLSLMIKYKNEIKFTRIPHKTIKNIEDLCFLFDKKVFLLKEEIDKKSSSDIIILSKKYVTG